MSNPLISSMNQIINFRLVVFFTCVVLLSGCATTLDLDYRVAGSDKPINGQFVQLGDFKNNTGFKHKAQAKSNLKYSKPITDIVKDALEQELVSDGYQIGKSNIEISGVIYSFWGQYIAAFSIKDTETQRTLFQQRVKTEFHHDMLLDTDAHSNNLRELLNEFLRIQQVQSILETSDSIYANQKAKQEEPPRLVASSLTQGDFSHKKKVALIIGNSRYKVGALKNPKNDAYDMANALRKLDFNVILKIDSNQQAMDKAIRDFGQQLSSGSVGLFYYAGHGVQVSGSNYLIPINQILEKKVMLNIRRLI